MNPRGNLNRREFLQLTSGAALAASVPMLLPAAALDRNGQADLIWRIGTSDHSADEFGAGSADTVIYDITRGAGPKQWKQEQEKPEQNYRILFDLPGQLPAGAVMVLEGFFRQAGPRAVFISVNGKRGWFRLVPRHARDADMRQGTSLVHTRVLVRAPLDSSLFRQGANEISIQLDGPGNLFYDSVRLERSAAPPGNDLEAAVEPTPFYRRAGEQLLEVTEVLLRQAMPLRGASVVLKTGSASVSAKFAGQELDFGEQVIELEVPALDAPQPYELTVTTEAGSKQFQGEYRPEKRWKLFAALKIHNDIGYTDLQQNVEELDGRNIDRVLGFASKYPDYKFNLEVSWLAEVYARLRKPARVVELMKLAGQNRVGIGGLYLNVLTGLCSPEELHRTLYYSKSLQRQYGVPLKSASMTDTPCQCWSLPSLLADAGITGFALGSNQHRGPVLVNSTLNEESPFQWEGPDGRRVLAFFSRSYHQLDRLVGGEPSVPHLRQTISQALARYRRDNYVPDALYLFGQSPDNRVLGDVAVRAMQDWNKTYEYPKFVTATDTDYFDYISQHFSGKLPVFRGDGGAYWADAAGSSAAETVLNRDSQRLLPLAETLSSWASLFDVGLAYPADALRDAWREVLFYDEHTWGAHNSISEPDRQFVTSQFEFKKAHAVRGHWAANDLVTHACSRLVQHINTQGPVMFIFNPSLHARNDLVETELSSNQELVDPATGKGVNGETVLEKKDWRRVRFLAENVPGLGYKTYQVRVSNEKQPANAPTTQAVAVKDSWEIESRHYRVVLDPGTGAVVHLIDKELKRDLVDPQAKFRLNELVYAAGGEGQQIVRNVTYMAPSRLDVSGQSGAELVENIRTSLGWRIRIRAKAKNVPLIESEIEVYDRLKRVDIRNHIRKEDVRAKEAIYFAFPFQAAPPDLQYQVHNTWARPNEDQLPGACKEWFTTANLVLSRDAGVTIAMATPDLPLVTLTDINRGRWPRRLEITNGHVYSYVTNNYWATNIKASQGGDLSFRYHISSAKDLDYDALARFDAETRSALVVYPQFASMDVGREAGARPMPAEAGSLFNVESAHAQITAFKEAEDGKGYILRLRETSARAGKAALRSPWFRIDQAFLTNAVEENVTPLQPTAGGVEIPLESRRFSTVRLIFASPLVNL